MNIGSKAQDNKVLLAKIVTTKGLRGELKLKSFTEDPLSIVDYEVFNDNNASFKIMDAYIHKGVVVVKIAGIDSIEKAEKLVGDNLYINRDEMPELEEDDFYYVDLIGLDVLNSLGKKIGIVSAIYNHGAGDLLDIKLVDESSELILFTKENVPEIDVSKGFIRVADINYVESKEEDVNN